MELYGALHTGCMEGIPSEEDIYWASLKHLDVE
jgi:hypothetical protein